MGGSEVISAGELRHRVTLQSPVMNAGGDEVDSWSDLATVFGGRRSMRGSEVMASGRDVSNQYSTWVIRYRSGVDAAKRLVHGSDTYEIDDVSNVNGANTVIEITCRLVK